MEKGSIKDKRKGRIILFAFGLLIMLVAFISSLINDGANYITVIMGLFVIMIGYSLIIEIFPQLGGTNKKIDNPSINDLKKKGNNNVNTSSRNTPRTEEQLKEDKYRELLRSHTFNHPIYGKMNMDLDYFDYVLREYRAANIILENKETLFSLAVRMSNEVDLDEFIQNDDIKNKVLSDYNKLMNENGEKLRKHLINSEYEQAWDWVSGLDNEDNIYYTGNKTKEEFKKVMEDNFKFISGSVSIDKNYNIIFLSLWSEIDEIYVWLATNVKDGKIDYEKITIDFSH